MMVRRFLVSAILLYVVSSIASPEGLDQEITYLKEPIRVFVGDFVNKSGLQQISAEDFVKSLKENLVTRRAVKFEVVGSLDESDIEISGEILKYHFLKEDPLAKVDKSGARTLDSSTTANYVDMEGDFLVVETRTGKVLWKSAVSTFLKKDVTAEESIP